MKTNSVIIGMSAVLVAVLAAVLLLQHRNESKLRDQNEALKAQVQQMDQLRTDNQRLSNLVSRVALDATPAAAKSNDGSKEVLRLRGEVGRLKQEQALDAAARKTNAASPLSSLTRDPEMQKMMRTQQKTIMGMIYKDFVKQSNIGTNAADQFQETMANHVMDNIDRITAVLKEGKTGADMDQIFKEQEVALQQKLQDLLGADGYQKYEDYTHNLASYLTAEQFKSMLSGDKKTKDDQSKQLYQVMQEETQAALANAGLGSDYQTVPTLNFRNFASEEAAEQSLQLLDGIYDKVSARAAAFLSPEDLEKFSEFRTTAIRNNRTGLAMNRRLMAPTAN
jgi:hypothetical protein